MDEIDWSKAPEGATHYNRQFCGWYKVTQIGAVFYWSAIEWRPARFWDDRKHDCIQRPTTPSWSGEGLPPVGVVCEYRVCDGPWYKCEIRYTVKHPDGGVIAYCPHLDHEQALYAPYCWFRPLRTPEQIAADEQETATDVMFARFGGVAGLTRKQCAWVISEGYRKP